jgi:hypothetical protein
MMGSALGLLVCQDAATANGDGLIYLVPGASSVTVCVSGTFNASIHFECTVSNGVWHEVSSHDLTSTSANDKAKTISAPGVFLIPHVAGMQAFRARISGYSSGAVTVRANATS